MIAIKQLYQDLWNAVNGICDKTYLRSRPKSIDKRIDSYIVVELPYTIYNNEIDDAGSYNDYTTTVQIGIYVRDKLSSAQLNEFNVNVMSEKVNAVFKKFPIKTENITASKPKVTIQADDGDGFGITIIQCSLRTK